MLCELFSVHLIQLSVLSVTDAHIQSIDWILNPGLQFNQQTHSRTPSEWENCFLFFFFSSVYLLQVGVSDYGITFNNNNRMIVHHLLFLLWLVNDFVYWQLRANYYFIQVECHVSYHRNRNNKRPIATCDAFSIITMGNSAGGRSPIVRTTHARLTCTSFELKPQSNRTIQRGAVIVVCCCVCRFPIASHPQSISISNAMHSYDMHRIQKCT